MSRAPTSPSRTRKQRERTVGRSRPSASAHRMIVTPAGGSSSVLSRADWASSFIRSRRLDDRHACAALDRHQLEVADEVLDAAVPRVGPTDDDLPAGTDRPEPMEVGVAAALDEPARPACAAGPVGRGGRAQQPGREVERERRLADPVRADEQDALRRVARGPWRSPRRARPAVPGSWRPSIGERSVGVGRAAALRVDRRFGAAAPASASLGGVRGPSVAGPRSPWRPPSSGAPAAWRPWAPGRVRVGRRSTPRPSAAGCLVACRGRLGGRLARRHAAWPAAATGRLARGTGLRGRSRRLALTASSAELDSIGRDRFDGLVDHRRSEPAGPEPASGRPGPEASPRARAGRRSTARSSCAAPTVPCAPRARSRRGCTTCPRAGGATRPRPGAHVGIAVDAATSAATAVPLTIHRGLVGGPTATSPSVAATATTARGLRRDAARR